jgi:hypothetical protein
MVLLSSVKAGQWVFPVSNIIKIILIINDYQDNVNNQILSRCPAALAQTP